MVQVIEETNLPVGVDVKKRKVRDIYDLGDKLLIITTDRISAFDYVLPNPIPYKGACLTQLSEFWFEKTGDIVPNHMITTDVNEFPNELEEYEGILTGRSMLVEKVKTLPVECIVRGYISGSAWKSYKKNGTVCSMELPKGLKESQEFPQPLFTPSTKAEQGFHDENISFKRMKEIVGKDKGEELKELSLKIYEYGRDYAKNRGVIIADTKFEFGETPDSKAILIDELLTPDSSRFWPADQYEPGHSQPSFDKQYVRDYLSSTGWDKNSPPPKLPEDVVNITTEKYKEAFQKITGRKLA